MLFINLIYNNTKVLGQQRREVDATFMMFLYRMYIT